MQLAFEVFDFAKRTQFPFGQSRAWEFALPAAECICGVFSSSKRTAEAVRCALPALQKLERYEARAIARRDQAIRNCFAKRTQFLSEKS